MELTIQEKKELGKRGFFAKNYNTEDGYFYQTRSLIFLYTILVYLLGFFLLIFSPILTHIFQINSNLDFVKFLLFEIVTLILVVIIGYSKYYSKITPTLYINSEQKVEYGIIMPNNMTKGLTLPFWLKKNSNGNTGTDKSYFDIFLSLIGLIIIPSFSLSNNYPITNLLLLFIGSWLLLGILILIILVIIRSIFQSFHPLYAFGNLGEKIQQLTPQIATQSHAMERNLASDMNYRVLSDGFDGLASTFSQIVSLVIRLEQVEKKTNKGNLFDSVKYINSLRSDITTPLMELRTFLTKQREKLIESQRQLEQMKIRGTVGLSENAQLSSRRGEELLSELDANIQKLDAMIEKMG